jgi:glycosyltransferase involved in cell wall biosynthesis
MPELSVIVPFVNEYPQVVFTLQSIAQELRDRVDFEVIAVDNGCAQADAQGYKRDQSGDVVAAGAGVNAWLKYLKYDAKLSHWQCKNHAVQNSSGRFLWFCDAHCVVGRDSLYNMFCWYRDNYELANGTMHLPVTYKILDSRSLIYKLVDNLDRGEMHYAFTPLGNRDAPFRVPCMSTCGMLMSREIYDELGGWPRELGIYGGGENFINFTLAVLGRNINIYPAAPLFHHGEKREYHYTYDDYTRNRTIATYIFGGEDLAARYIEHRKGNAGVNKRILEDVLDKCWSHRDMIKNKQQLTIGEWALQWKL